MEIGSSEFSRIAATAATLGEAAVDRHRFLDKRVLLTGDPEVLETENGRNCFLAAAHLVPRICANVVFAVPRGALLDEARAVAERIAFGQQIAFVEPGTSDDSFDAVLSVGTRARPDDRWTLINNDGWLVRLTSDGEHLPRPSGRENPMSALAAASLGIAEVFKRLLGLKPSRGGLLRGLSWSLYTYATGSEDIGPPLPCPLPVDVIMGGVGAIGNGVLYLLGLLPLTGRVIGIDSQTFGSENLGTCMLIGPQDVGTPKATLVERALAGRVAAKGYHEPLNKFASRLGKEVPYAETIIGALDNIEARHALQDLWPAVLLDGAIGPFLCQASRHPIDGDVACARCLFRQPPGERAEVIASRATGLTVERALMPDEVVTQDDVERAPPEKRQWLAEKVGKPICSIVSEATVRELTDGHQSGFEPSVPFVATLASSMVVGELIKAALQAEPAIEPRFQFDVLRGPASGQLLPQGRRRDCYCVKRARQIAAWRDQRRNPIP